MIFNILNNLETFEKYFPGSEGSLAPWIPGYARERHSFSLTASRTLARISPVCLLSVSVLVLFSLFLSRDADASAVLGVVILSVSPSVCLSVTPVSHPKSASGLTLRSSHHSRVPLRRRLRSPLFEGFCHPWYKPNYHKQKTDRLRSTAPVLSDKIKQCTADILISHEKAITLVCWHQQWLVDDAPFHLKFALKVTHLPSKNADFDRFPLITSQPWETAKKLHLRRIGSRPRAFQRATDGVSTLPLSPKGGWKSDFLFKKNKIQFQSNNVCYKVSLCENFRDKVIV